MQEFKIKVTPEQSAEVQNCLLNLGFIWCDGTRKVAKTKHEFLFFSNNYYEEKTISIAKNEWLFKQRNIQEIKIEEFRELYAKENCYCAMECLADCPHGELICRHLKNNLSTN